MDNQLRQAPWAAAAAEAARQADALDTESLLRSLPRRIVSPEAGTVVTFSISRLPGEKHRWRMGYGSLLADYLAETLREGAVSLYVWWAAYRDDHTRRHTAMTYDP